MSKDENVYEKIEYVQKYLNRVSKSFEDSHSCKKCSESCTDMFYNGYKKAIEHLDNIHKELTELKLAEQERLDKEKISKLSSEKAIIINDEFFLDLPMEDEFISPVIEAIIEIERPKDVKILLEDEKNDNISTKNFFNEN